MTADEAVERARALLGIDPAVPGRGWRVRWLADGQPWYFLVAFGLAGATMAVAAVDARSGSMFSHARLPGTREHAPLSAEAAVHAAGMAEGSTAILVWKPSDRSRSPLYPLWEVRDGRDVAYVDLSGVVSRQLAPGGPGGAPD